MRRFSEPLPPSAREGAAYRRSGAVKVGSDRRAESRLQGTGQKSLNAKLGPFDQL